MTHWQDSKEDRLPGLPYRHCWICGELFGPCVSAIALTATGDMIGPIAFEFPDCLYQIRVKGQGDWWFDHWDSCPIAQASGEIATAHMYCVKLYQAMATPRTAGCRLDRLWATMVRRRAWPDCPGLMLPPHRDYGHIMARVRAFDCFKDMPLLPPDLDAMIGQHLVAGPLVQLCAVEDMIQQLEQLEGESLSRQEFDLVDIELWERGSCPPLVSGPLDDESRALTGKSAPVFVCIDWMGIRSIKKRPWMNETTRGCYFMVVEEPGQVKVDFLRLDVADFHPLSYHQPFDPDMRNKFNAVSLASCFGLTFFTGRGGNILSIHAHTREAPTAEHAHKQWAWFTLYEVAWVYVPMVADRLLKFGIRYQTQSEDDWWPVGYKLWMEKAGLVSVGQRRNVEDTAVFNVEPGAVLLYGQIASSEGGAFLGISPKEVASSSQRWRSQSPVPLLDASDCYSSASLEEVTGVWVYTDGKAGFCRGIILDYSNGSRRALGSCKFGVDRAQFCADLERIRFTHVGTPDQRLDCQVFVDANLPSTHEEWKSWRSLHPCPPQTWAEAAAWIDSKDWASWPRGGLLEVWFEFDNMMMSVRGPSESGNQCRDGLLDW